MKRFVLVAALLGSAALMPAGAQPASQPLKVVLVDVEGGAATLYVTPDGKSLLVDTGWPAGMGGSRPPAPAGAPGATSAAPPSPPAAAGPSSADRIVAAAHRLGLSKIDYVLVTHYHVDHLGGLSELLGKIPVGSIMDHGPNREQFVPTPQRPNPPDIAPQAAYPSYLALAEQHNHHVIKAGDTLRIGALTLHFVTSDGEVPAKPLWPNLPPTPNCAGNPPAPANDGGEENARSVGFVASYGNARIVALGDASWATELKLVCPVNLIGPADLFLVTQHGSAISNTPSLIADIAPRVALMGNGSRKGGDAATFERLAAAPSKPVVWQVHQAVRDMTANRPDKYIANLDGPTDDGYSLEALVYPDGKITVVNSRNNFTETYTK
jgi:beta-lactamase superfamily II metal-dependent hydrolase